MQQFRLLFQRLVSNPWKFLPDKHRLASTEILFYEKLNEYDFEQIKVAFDNVLTDKDQQWLPSLQRVMYELERLKAPEKLQPRPKADPARRERRKKYLSSVREVIAKHGNDKKRLVELSNEFKGKL